jgi:hypothetical protein
VNKSRCSSPLSDFTRFRFLCPNDLVGVQQAKRVEGLLKLYSVFVSIHRQSNHWIVWFSHRNRYWGYEGQLCMKAKPEYQGRRYGNTNLSHSVDCALAKFMGQVVSLDQSNAMFALRHPIVSITENVLKCSCYVTQCQASDSP